MTQQAADTPTRIITLNELEQHGPNSERQWCVIEGNVVDFTEYKHSHPGGDEILEENAGKDATEAFIQTGHSADARREMAQYVIGKLEQHASVTTSTSLNITAGSDVWRWATYTLVPVAVVASVIIIKKYVVDKQQNK
jgi:cytochrome b involved in lipid metabolism